MTKKTVTDWGGLMLFARARAKKSAKRNDPWAWAYWRCTARWAGLMREDPFMKTASNWLPTIGLLVSQAKARSDYDFSGAALFYSQAKWLAIMLRNRGVKVPRAKGPSLEWLHKIDG